jgi:hypothetical protein
LPEATCTTVSRSRGEPLFATASHVPAWLLIEQPGPWGSEALLESRLDRAVGRDLLRRGRAAGVRVVLIRRTRRTRAGPRQVFVARTDRRARWLEELRVDDPAELLGLDWTRLSRGEPGHGARAHGTVYLACTNGRHDQCCATWGRPLAQGLAAVLGARVWECSHIGGDRFAGNLVCLPEGVYYGRLGVAEAARVAEQHERGRIDLDHYRGRCVYPPVIQAAEHFLRRELGITGLDDLVAQRRETGAEGVVAVTFGTVAAGRWVVRLRVGQAPTARLLTCQSTRPERPPVYRLLDLARLDPGEGGR